MSDRSIAALLDDALDAYAALTELGESIDDEWTYVNDLATAWRDRLNEVAAVRGGESAPPETAAAVDAASEEIGRITDPHRAIDWLSTYPQVVLLAVGERP